MVCSECGGEISADWKFCPFCRTPIADGPAEAGGVAVATAETDAPQPLPDASAPPRLSMRKRFSDTLALVVGVTDGESEALDYVEPDVEQMLRLLEYLRVPSSRIIRLVGPSASRARLQQQLRSVLPARLKPRTRLILFFAGPVVDVVEASGYVNPVFMTAGADPARPRNGGLGLKRILGALADAPLHHVLLIADACSEALCGEAPGAEYLTAALRNHRTLKAFDIITAGRGGQSVHTHSRGSAFMDALCRSAVTLNGTDGDRHLTARDCAALTYKAVWDASTRRQSPAFWHVAGGDDVLVGPHAAEEHATTMSVLSVVGGTVTITSDPPGADVLLNTTGRGRTPLELRIPAGHYDIKVAMSGYEPYHASFKFGGHRGRLHARLHPLEDSNLPEGLVPLGTDRCARTHWPMRVLRTRDQCEMVLVSGGTFLLGANDGDPDERPAHRVALPAFYIDRYAVTNEAYEQYLGACGASRPKYWKHDLYGRSRQPVVGVSHFEVSAYCNWAGAMLPTEAQWECAAAGPRRRNYPWGHAVPSQQVARYRVRGAARVQGPTNVDVFPTNLSPYGAQQMSGNVWEWCRDWYDEQYYLVVPDTDPTGPGFGVRKTMRGGAWNSHPKTLRCASRGKADPEYRGPDVGFRCVVPCPADPALS